MTLVELANGNRRVAIPNPPLLSSRAAPWSSLFLEHHAAGRRQDVANVTSLEHVLIAQIQGPSILEWRDNGHYRSICFLPGQVIFVPALLPFSCRTLHSGEIVAVALDPQFVRLATHDLARSPNTLDLIPRIPMDDPFVHSLIMSLHREVQDGCPAGATYGESLATALAAHLVARHSESGALPAPSNGGLSRAQLRQAIDFLQARLADDITIGELAAHCGLSTFHFARLFKRATGLSPHQYLIRCRVERAREYLLASSKPTAEVALDVGFCDQSHLTTHFRKVFGITPREFRRQHSPGRLLPETA